MVAGSPLGRRHPGVVKTPYGLGIYTKKVSGNGKCIEGLVRIVESNLPVGSDVVSHAEQCSSALPACVTFGVAC